MAPPLPMDPCKARAVGCALNAPLSLVWGVETQPIEKQRGRWGLGLRWPPFDDATQQSTESWRQQYVVCYSRAGGGGSAGGYTVQSFGAANWATKNKWKWNTTRPYMATNQWIFTQQPTKNRQPRRRGLRRGGVTSGRRGGARYHCFLEGGSRIRSKNLKKIVEFSK